MSKGCTKADRQRKSNQNTNYKNQNKKGINANKRLARHKKAIAAAKAKVMKTPRGTARRLRRAKETAAKVRASAAAEARAQLVGA